MRKNQHAQGLWVTWAFLCIVICFDIFSIITPDKEFSESENRMLAKFPSFNAKEIYNGTFSDETEKYLSDQFVFRDAWSEISFFTRNKIFGQNEMNGVYIGKDGFLMLIPAEPEPEALKMKLSAINALTEKYGDINHGIAVIPNAVTVMTNKLPAFVPKSNQPEQLSYLAENLKGIQFFEVTQPLIARNDEDLYYHTDHHWTSLGAYIAFKSMASQMGIDPNDTQYDIYTVSESFQGTLASKSGSQSFRDKIEIYVPKDDHSLSVRYSDGEQASGTLYQKAFLETKDQYAVFLGGNHPIVTVTTTSDTDRTLMIIKDSYANCFIQFLTPYFDQIIMVDPRYCFESADMIIDQYDITDLIYLYNADTFMTDTSLTDFLTFESAQTE